MAGEPFDRAGWIVRFELPGSVALSSGPVDGGSPAAASEALPPGGQSDAGPLSLVVSICPLLEGQKAAAVHVPLHDGLAGGESSMEGAALSAAPASAALAKGRGKHAGLAPTAAADGARP